MPVDPRSYAERRAAAKAARMGPQPELSKREQRVAKMKARVSGGRRIDKAESASHQGVSENPMRNYQSLLDKKRAEKLQRGTSIARVKRHGNEEDEEEAKKHSQELIQRTPLSSKMAGVLKRLPKK